LGTAAHHYNPSTLRMLRQEDYKFEASPGYKVRSYLQLSQANRKRRKKRKKIACLSKMSKENYYEAIL
jgi:hypothetical protein